MDKKYRVLTLEVGHSMPIGTSYQDLYYGTSEEAEQAVIKCLEINKVFQPIVIYYDPLMSDKGKIIQIGLTKI